VLATVLAAADVFVQGSAVLIGLVVIAPLVAATAASPARTAWVAGYSFAIALAVGIPVDFFGSRDHLLGVLTVVAGGLLAVWIARLRQGRERESRQLGVQYGAARVLSDAESLEAIAPRLVEAVGLPLGWKVGRLWELRPPGVLKCAETWSAPEVDGGGFERLGRQFVMRPGVGLAGRVWETGEPVWIPDLTEESFPSALEAGRVGLRGAIGFPLRGRRGVIGVAEFFAREIPEPDEDLRRLMAALGTQIGEFAEGLQAQQALRRSEELKTAMLDVALDGVITIDNEGKVVEFNPAAVRIFGYAAADAVGREMAELIVPPALRDRHRKALRRQVETGESTILGKRLELTGMRADGSEFPVELAISRIAGQDPPMYTGFVRELTDRKQGEREREELLRLEQMARVDVTQAREQLEAILAGVADAITAQATDGSLLFANDAAVRTLGYSTREELLAAPLSKVMERFDVMDEEGRPFPLDQLPGRRALEGEYAEAVTRFRIRATGEERWSVVKATPIFDAEGQVTMAINVIEDITIHKRAEREQYFLAESSRILASSLNLDATLRRVATFAVPDVADWVAVDLREPDGGLARVALAHADREQLERAQELQVRYPPDPRADRGVPQVLRTGQPQLYPEIPEEMLLEAAVDERHHELLREFGMRSAMIVPMMARDRTLGALSFVSGPSGRRFDDQDLALAQELARRCATAIDNARLYSERAYIAQTLQQSLLPAELPRIPGLEAAARFHAMGEGTEVGGDFYDLFQTGPHGWTVVVGDVCGKGPDAAAVTALARHTLRTAAMSERLPSRTLALLNEALMRQEENRRFCTVAYAYLEPVDVGARVGFASGGHPLPIVVRSGGKVEWLGVHGTVLGVVPDPDLEDRMVELSPGDALVFYTDGVTEARGGRDGPLGEKRLAEIVSGYAGHAADEIAARVEMVALEMQHGEPRDDIAVVVLRVGD
jgi:PAS domain S-box-containing protein